MDKSKETMGKDLKNIAEGKTSANFGSKKSRTAFSVSNFLAGVNNKPKKIDSDAQKTKPAEKQEQKPPVDKVQNNQSNQEALQFQKPVLSSGGLVASIYNSKKKTSKPEPEKSPKTNSIEPAKQTNARASKQSNLNMPNGYMGQMPPNMPGAMPQYPNMPNTMPNNMPYGYPYGFMGYPYPNMQGGYPYQNMPGVMSP
ncbi:MAG: hypothetical protein IJT25_03030, partial [Clostridia bacterium]|nr:hypothetical protein [Clostridia bacterium]